MKTLRQLSLALFCCAIAHTAAGKTNVLMIVADDLRCDISAYGHSEALTSHLDALAARARVFGRAYCQQAVCNPSRASMMTGLRPDHIGVTDLRTHFRETAPDINITTVSQHFKNHGYQAVGIGKIYHNYHLRIQGDPASWSVPQRDHWGNHRMDQPKAPGHRDVPFDRLGLRDTTHVVFWSDNGYHLGENEMVGKLTNFERDTRVPLMISSPGMPQAGEGTRALVEMVDLYPTLLDLCELPAPAHKLDGVSLRPVSENPLAITKTVAVSQHPDDLTRPRHMGYSARDASHRYTEWREIATGRVAARELYAYDERLIETENLAGIAAEADRAAALAAQLPAAVTRGIPPPPGTVIHYSPASSGRYIGSPSICIAPDGSYLASHDLFGPQSNEFQLARGRLYRSTDKGETWNHLRDFDGFFWTGLFTHRGAVYLLGLDKHHGRILIRKSADNGKTWTEPTVIAEGQWHTAPMPVVEHHGRLWRAIEDAHTSNKWGERYRARMISAPADANLLESANWIISSALARDPAWLENDGFAAWLEGNAVAAPDGSMCNILRVDTPGIPEKAAIVRISADGTAASFDPQNDLIDMPGGAKKFTIRKDPAGSGYWTIASIIPDAQSVAGRPAATRNTLALLHSPDLRNWQVRSILLRHPDLVKHGFQYVDWQFEGDDLIAACRTAWDDDQGGARNHHDANFLTFHRVAGFRSMTRDDDAPMPEIPRHTLRTPTMEVFGHGWRTARLDNGAKAFLNRNYVFHEVPETLRGSRFTMLPGGEATPVTVTARADTTLHIATALDQQGADLAGWTPLPLSFHYNDPGKTRLTLHSRKLAKGETLEIPTGNWTGALLLLDVSKPEP